MNFDNFPQSSSASSQDEGSIIDQIVKTKPQATKFFNELNKQQKSFTKKMMFRRDQTKPISNRKKNIRQSSTFKEMILGQDKYLQRQNSQTIDQTRPVSKKKVMFDKKFQRDKNRKTSLQRITQYDFCESIKLMALQIIGSKQHSPNSSSVSLQVPKQNQTLFTGFTQKQFHDGTKFKGICENGVIIKGQLHFSNGFVYNGELFLDKFHGKGTLRLPKKQVIQADWIQGQIVGKATIRYPKGQIYYGDLKNFRRHGQGHLFFNDGSKYEGQFNQGQLTGYGVHMTTTGQITSGYWFYGDFVGKNQQVFQNIMANTAAHQKKKTERITKNFKNTSLKNVGKSSNFFERFLLDHLAAED